MNCDCHCSTANLTFFLFIAPYIYFGCGSVQYALEELPGIRHVTVSRTDVMGTYGHHSSVQHRLGYYWDVTFVNPAGNVPLLQVSHSPRQRPASILQAT